ncbi:MAG: hypothetical protein F4164_10935 [Gemmatimonadales bacterium]|nr:hypothetical protein [Gemmatimonadales bacterium]MYG49852.1 hypothetical protein [Gemmatimonadales bacterium]MYK03224.1 hypothetical protein [Candidatus Palauibacter ramosifaciens]
MRALRGLAALTLAGLAVAAAYLGLRSLGFQPRWEVEAPASPPPSAKPGRRLPPPPAELRSRVPPAPSTPPAAPDAAGDTEEGDAPQPEGGPVGSGPYAQIEFETYGDGRPVVSNSAVADEWRGQGLVLSFESYTAAATQPHVLDASGYRPPGSSTHALGPPLSGDRGLEVGVIHLEFPGRPRKVAFTLFGPDLIESFHVTVRSRGARLPASVRNHSPDMRYDTTGDGEAGKATYSPGGRSRFRAERVIVETPLGIDRISLDAWGPPGHVLLVDHVDINP